MNQYGQGLSGLDNIRDDGTGVELEDTSGEVDQEGFGLDHNIDVWAGIELNDTSVKTNQELSEPDKTIETWEGPGEIKGKISAPFQPSLVRVTTMQMSIDLLLRRIEHNELDLRPDFQRRDRIWTKGAESRLIESLLLRIPLPAFYVDATNDEKWLVVDGLQRLTTLKRFVLDKTLELCELEFRWFPSLYRKTYTDLARPLQRRITETQVTVHVIEKGTPSEARFNIF